MNNKEAQLMHTWSHQQLLEHIHSLRAENEKLRGELRKINTPEIDDFIEAVINEAKYQRLRWSTSHDGGKTDADWFWLIGYLAGKAIMPVIEREKKIHHIITTAAACLNWYAREVGQYGEMRPGISGPETQCLSEIDKEKNEENK